MKIPHYEAIFLKNILKVAALLIKEKIYCNFATTSKRLHNALKLTSFTTNIPTPNS